MKAATLFVLFLGFGIFPSLHASDDTPYQVSLRRLEDRLLKLEMERSDTRRVPPGLPSDLEKQYQQVLGEVLLTNPVWGVIRELEHTLRALLVQPVREAGDDALIETLKDLLAQSAIVLGQAKDLTEAEKHAETLRRFIVKRDVKGLGAWTRSFR